MNVSTIGVLDSTLYQVKKAVIRVIGYVGNRITIEGVYFSKTMTIEPYEPITQNCNNPYKTPEGDTVKYKDIQPMYYTDFVVPAPGKYHITNNSVYSIVDGVNKYATEDVDAEVGSKYSIMLIYSANSWLGIKAILNAHKEKEYLRVGQYVSLDMNREDYPTVLDPVNAILYTIDNVPHYKHAVVYGCEHIAYMSSLTPGTKPNAKAINFYSYMNTSAYEFMSGPFKSAAPPELLAAITPRRMTQTAGSKRYSLVNLPEQHFWLPRIYEVGYTAWNNTSGANEFGDSRNFQLCQVTDYKSTYGYGIKNLASDGESSSQLWYTCSPLLSNATNYCAISHTGEPVGIASYIKKNNVVASYGIVPFFMIAADDNTYA